MDTNRRLAVCAGVLFIVATAANVAGVGLSSALLDGKDYLAGVAAHAGRVTSGVLLELVAAGACAGIAIAMYPVLRRHGPALALGSVVFRTMEGLLYAVAAVGLLGVLALSGRLTTLEAADRATAQAVGDSLLDVREQAALVGVLAFCVGGLMYYAVLYRSRLVPRWLSGWGVVAVVLAIIAWLLALFGHRPVTDYTVMMLPLAAQEMVLAVWLIAKGFAVSMNPRSEGNYVVPDDRHVVR